MGNCCGGEDDEPNTVPSRTAFQGEGHRLGTADEAQQMMSPPANAMDERDHVPEPAYNPNLTDSDRARVRADRAAAAEARMKKQGIKKPKKESVPPLVGPNTEPAMRWNVG